MEKLFSEFKTVTREEWEEIILKDLKGQDYSKKLHWRPLEGLDVKPYYISEDVDRLEFVNQKPGDFPFVRGNASGNNWLALQTIVTANISDANEAAVLAIENGIDGIYFNAEEIFNTNHLSILLKGIDPEKVHLYFKGASCFRFFRNLLSEYFKENGIDPSKVKGGFSANPIGKIIRKGEFNESIESVFIKLAELIDGVNENLPHFSCLELNGDVFQNAGAHVIQELAFTLSLGNDYLAYLTDRNIKIDHILPRINISLGIGSNYFLEIAKFRAMRILWARLTEKYNPKTDDLKKVIIQAVSTDFNKNLYDPHTNILRLTTEAMSAIIGGADGVTLLPFDQVYALTNSFSTRISRNIHNLLREESYLSKVGDPAGGSYYIENLTNQVLDKTWQLFYEIEKEGGFIECLKKNIIQDAIEDTNLKRKEAIVQRKENILGVTIFPETNEKFLDKNKLPVSEKQQQASEFKIINPLRKSVEYENIRLNAEIFEQKGKNLPSVFLLPFGDSAMSMARMNFSKNFFGCSGYKIIENSRFATIDHSLDLIKKTNPEIIILCSSDDDYKQHAADAGKRIKEVLPKTNLILAGNPAEIAELLKQSGFDNFIHIKSNLIETIQYYHKLFNII